MKKKPAAPTEIEPSFVPVADAFKKTRDVTGGVMMASFGLKVNGRIFAMFSRGAFVAKLPRARVDELVAAGTGVRFDAGKGTPMKEWISVPGAKSTWVDLAKEAYRFVKSGKP